MYNLKEKEEIVFEVRPSVVVLIYYLLPTLIAVAGLIIIFSGFGRYMFYVVIAILVVGLFVAAAIVLSWYLTTYRLTTKRVESKSGILGFKEEEISLDDVLHIDVIRTFAGIIFDYGTILIRTAGPNAAVEFVNISSPTKMAVKIEDLSIEAGGELKKGEEGDKIVEI